MKFRGKNLLLVQNPILTSTVLDLKCCISFYVLEFVIESWLPEAFQCWKYSVVRVLSSFPIKNRVLPLL